MGFPEPADWLPRAVVALPSVKPLGMTIRDTHFTARRLFLEACGVRPLRNLLAADNRVSGIIWCGHSVRAGTAPGGYRPNEHLVLTTDFLDRLLFMLREAQIPVVRLAEARAR